MPTVEAEDGVVLHWRATGDGPPVVIGDNVFSVPEVLNGLEEDLSRDHRVVFYDPRGCGQSTRTGPFDLATDVKDLAAVAEAVGGGPAVAVGPANGAVVATLLAAERPDLIGTVIAPTGVPVITRRLGHGLAASREVLEAIGTGFASDYRTLVRSIVTTGNPQLDEEGRRRRVEAELEYRPAEAARGRWESWYGWDDDEAARAIGDRLWILLHPNLPWWPVELAEPLRELLPEAHVEIVEDGPLSRPDIVAGVVRGITGDKP
jgi:pimeloyl-ACP methyl ester carboxylesterase